MNFVLAPRLEQDSYFLTSLSLSEVRLHKNAAFPWLILIPRRANMVEIIDLNDEDQNQLLKEIRLTSHILKNYYQPQKLNIANLGNIVSQLHIHIIARFETDKAWPQPIWCTVHNAEYSQDEKSNLLAHFVKEFKRIQ